MKVYNKEGQSMNADKDQMQILLDAGWKTTAPIVHEDIPILEEKIDEEVEEVPVKISTPLIKKGRTKTTIKKIPIKE